LKGGIEQSRLVSASDRVASTLPQRCNDVTRTTAQLAPVPDMKGLCMVAKAHAFDVGDYVVYPKHGVGRVIELQEQEIAGMTLELYVLRFEKERMTLRVPTNKVEAIGMRKLSSDKTLREALDTLKGKPKVKRTMWSRRAQEYEAKINSGDLVSIAEVTRDLFRADDQPEQSYSERQIFEAASSRLARELAAMEKTDEPAALKKILAILNEHAPKYYAEAATV
jgi:CarD family transcriptional regulator